MAVIDESTRRLAPLKRRLVAIGDDAGIRGILREIVSEPHTLRRMSPGAICMTAKSSQGHNAWDSY